MSFYRWGLDISKTIPYSPPDADSAPSIYLREGLGEDARDAVRKIRDSMR